MEMIPIWMAMMVSTQLSKVSTHCHFWFLIPDGQPVTTMTGTNDPPYMAEPGLTAAIHTRPNESEPVNRPPRSLPVLPAAEPAPNPVVSTCNTAIMPAATLCERGDSITPLRPHQMKEDCQKKRLRLTHALNRDREVHCHRLGPGTAISLVAVSTTPQNNIKICQIMNHQQRQWTATTNEPSQNLSQQAISLHLPLFQMQPWTFQT